MADKNFVENAVGGLYEFMATKMPTAATEDEKKIFNSFAAEITDDDDAPPVFACRDAKYYLTIQREKMKSLGISVKDSIVPSGASGEISGSNFDSKAYIGRRLFRQYDRKAIYYLNDKKIYTYKDRLTLYQMLVNAKKGISPDTPYLCPSCGAPSTIGGLETGCKYCDSHFKMSELFPKVMGHYWLRAYSIGKGDMPKRVFRYVSLGVIIGVLIGFFLNVSGVWDSLPPSANVSGIAPMLYLGIMGFIVGLVLSSVSLMFRPLADSVKSMPLLSRVRGSKKELTEYLSQNDPYFFYEIFENKVISLFQIMMYAKNPSESSAYYGDKAIPQTDVIESVYRGALELLDIRETNNSIYVSLTIFADSFYLDGKKMGRANEEYRMIVFRNKDAVTDPNFSLIKVECPSCGGSFDATSTKSCPYCNRPYHLYDFDWTVYSFERVG